MSESMKSTHIVSKIMGEYVVCETTGDSEVYDWSEFFVAKDGTWLMVDWIDVIDSWYVTMGA
jgi:hypothetical protein